MSDLFKNINTNAPWWYKRFETGMITIMVPAFTAFITSIPMSDDKKVYYLAGGVLFAAVVKFIGVLMGSSVNGNGNGTNSTK